ncbi:MAG: class I SAM-dependent methyltransferase [Minwuia sp.]|nr:class I SAM-dependent methyltransferase [Minwuia sp.]
MNEQEPSDDGEKAAFKAGDYWESRLSQHYTLQGVGDIGLPLSYNNWLYRVRASAFRHVLKHLQGNPGDWSILDVGSGTGFYIEQWTQRRPRMLAGADITATAVRNLSGRFPNAVFMQIDIGSDLPETLQPGSLDVITAYDVLFHIVEKEPYARAMRNFSDLIRPGGYLIFSDNLVDDGRNHDTHQISRTEGDVRDLLHQNGFSIEKVVPMFVFMNDPVRSRSRIMRALFNRIYRLAARSETWGQVVGAALYPIEVAALRLLSRGPSTEIFICRRDS